MLLMTTAGGMTTVDRQVTERGKGAEKLLLLLRVPQYRRGDNQERICGARSESHNNFVGGPPLCYFKAGV